MAVVFVAAFCLYANTIGHDYALDDTLVASGNRYTQAGLRGIPALLTTDSFQGYLGGEVDEVAGGRYRPLSLITFAIEQQLFGASPHLSHFGNAMLYALCCVVLYVVLADLLRGLGAQRGFLYAPLLAALVFAAHPVHTEVVANIKGRDEILALMLALLSLWLWLRAVERSDAASLVAGAGLFFLALLAKENAITFLAIVPLSFLFFRPDSVSGLKRIALSMGVVSLTWLALRQSVVVTTPGEDELLNNPFLDASLSDTYATIFYTLGRYLKLLVWPHPLTHDYSPYHIPILSWSDWRPWLGLGLHLGLGLLALVGYRRFRVVSFGIAFYLVTLSIVSNLFFPIGTFMGERFLFMPSAGFCLVVGWLLAETLPAAMPVRRIAVGTVTLAFVSVFISFAYLTITRNQAWKDNFTLIADVEVSARSASANANAAHHLAMRAGETKDEAERSRLVARAVSHLETALEIHPRYQRALAMLGTIHQDFRGDVGRALADYERLYAMNPDWPRLAYKLGTLYLQHRPERLDAAVRVLERATVLQPEDADAHGNLGAAYYLSGDLERAAASLETAVLLDPDDVDRNRSLAEVLRETGDTEKFERYRSATHRLGGRLGPASTQDGDP